MKKQLNILLILISLSFSTILNVDGEEYTTIQSAIDDAETGDTVLVHQGLYYENLDINKTITLTSLAMYDNLDTWYEYESITAQYEISNDNIVNTIIDASEAVDENFTSGIVVRSPEDECIFPVIMGFTIRGGMGTMVTEEVEMPETGEIIEVNRKIGGGLFSYMTNADIHHNQFTNNGDPSVENGGAVYAQTSTEDWGFDNRSSGRPRCEINEINIHDNFYRDNDAIYGNTFSNRTFTDEINLTNSLFDIYNCPESNVTGVWVDILTEADPNYSGSQGDLCAINDDIWISSTGNNFNGDGTSNNPLKTISFALEIIAPNDENPVNIYIDEGTYSPSLTGEIFPLTIQSNINIYGNGNNETILDAEQTSTLFIFSNSSNSSVSSLKIYNGMRNDYSGGGIFAINSNIQFYSIEISNNMSSFSGGGAFIDNSILHFQSTIFSENYSMNSGGGLAIFNQSEILMENVQIYQNLSDHSGGGIFAYGPNLDLNIYNSYIFENNANFDGGGLFSNMSVINLDNIHIHENHSQGSGGGFAFSDSDIILNNLIINNNSSDFSGGGGFFNLTNISINNIQLYENSSGHSGGGISFFESNGIINQITVLKNVANYLDDINYPHHGGGVFIDSSPNLYIVNSIIRNNLLNDYRNDIEASNVNVIHTNYEVGIGVYPDESNNNQNPLFVDYNNNDFSLNFNSPCIDNGTNYYELSNTLILDLNEESYFGSSPDQGAIEFKINGDINQDNMINIQDIIVMVNIILGNIEINDNLLNNGDINQDSFIDVNDIIEVVFILVNYYYE